MSEDEKVDNEADRKQVASLYRRASKKGRGTRLVLPGSF